MNGRSIDPHGKANAAPLGELRVARGSADLLNNPHLKSGTTFKARVLKHLGANTWSIKLFGNTIQVKTLLSLVPGMTIRGQVARQGEILILRLRSTEGNPLSSISPPSSLSAHELATFFLDQSGISYTKADVKWIVSLLRRIKPTKNKRAFFIQMLTNLVDKRLKLSPVAVKILWESTSGEGNEHRHGPRNHDSGGNKKRPSDQEPERPPHLPVSASSEPNPVNVFNHAIGEVKNWILIPYRSTDDLGPHGSLRIPLNNHRKPTGFTLSVAATSLFDNQELFFTYFPESHKISISSVGEIDLKKSSFFLQLHQKLRNLGLETDDTILNTDRFSGVPSSPHGIDEYA